MHVFVEKTVSKFNDEFIQYSEKKGKSENTHKALSLSVQIFLYILLIFFAIFFIWYTAFISTHKYYLVYGASMKNTLNSSLSLDNQSDTEDALYVNTIARTRVFDIVVAKRKVYNAEKKEWETKDVVKRLMALEGDFISIAMHQDEDGNQRLYFYRIPKGTNLQDFDDESARLDESTGDNGYTIFSYDEWTERKDLSTFVDDGTASSDALNKYFYEENFFTTFFDGHLEEIVSGSEDFFVSNGGLVYVKVPKGKFFCMGDNRGHSGDCRDNGFYETDQIVGKAEIVVYSHNFGKRVLKVVEYYFSQVEKFFAR